MLKAWLFPVLLAALILFGYLVQYSRSHAWFYVPSGREYLKPPLAGPGK